ncbi:MAG: cobyrinate a,c-diamide synthase, partial [Zoogloea sp.]|nr:cobyrinate a,c-diamide synthase [Zoogloea sp.]
FRSHTAAEECDLILVEGVMGLFDGHPSGADIATRFGLPVMAVIDGSAMAQTFGAIAFGLKNYRPGLPFAGVLANRVGSDGHAHLLSSSLPPGVGWFGRLPGEADITMPERHLGLAQAGEMEDLLARLDRAADLIAETSAVDLPTQVEFPEVRIAPPAAELAGVRVAVARDTAFGFIYQANLDCLEELGAEVCFFSPLADAELPACDALWLPGGYPELHAARLADNAGLRSALAEHHAEGKPILAECGGMMSLFETLVDQDGREHESFGLLPGRCWMQPRLSALGLQSVRLPEGRLHGHTFHYSRSETSLAPLVLADDPHGGRGEAVYRSRRLTASYVHLYFPSNPEAVAALLLPA